MEKHCIVKDCKNTDSEMTFYDNLCAQCYAFITQGVGECSQVYKNMVNTLMHRLYLALKRMSSEFNEEPPVIKSVEVKKIRKTNRKPPVTYKEAK